MGRMPIGGLARRLAAAACLGPWAGQPATAAPLVLPSGLEARLFDVILEPEAGLARFRFVAPAIGTAGFGYAEVAGDFQFLCEAYALPALAANGLAPREIVISFSAREVPFGEPTATIQFFEPFRVDGTDCAREDF